MNIRNISIKWQLMMICILLVTIPTIIMGYISYQTHERETFSQVEEKLMLLSSDWKITTESYINQMDRVLKREEVMVEQRLSSIAMDIHKIFGIVVDHGGDIPGEDMEYLLGKISEIKIGRSGYVSILDSKGTLILSEGRLNDGVNLWDAKDGDGNYFVRDVILESMKLGVDETFAIHYPWEGVGQEGQRMKLTVTSYYEPLDIIIAVTSYYTDFKSYELEKQLQNELRDLMASQEIGDNGYIWVVNSGGDYVVSKDRLRDGENIWDSKDSNEVYVIQEIIKKAKSLGEGENYVSYYPWKNIGEDEEHMKISSVTYVPEWDWIIGVSAYHDDFLKGLQAIKLYIISISLISIVLGSIVAYMFAMLISKPIKKLEEITVKASEGNLKGSVGKDLMSTMGEVGSLSRSFNTMIENIKNKVGELEKSSSELIKSNKLMKHTQDKLKDKNEQLLKFNRLAIRRELKMIELKKKLDEQKK